jgi:competence protein ComEC
VSGRRWAHHVVVRCSLGLRLALAALGVLLVFTAIGTAASRAPAAQRGKIVFVNVAQGDGVVIKLGSTIVVSDVGEHKVENVDATLRDLDAKQIDVAILTHPHQDHVANLLSLARDYHWTIKQAVITQSQWWQGTDTNRAIVKLLDDLHVPVELATRAQRYHWGGGEWLILNPPKGDFSGGSDQAANASLAYLLSYNGVTALFTGDVEAKTGRRIAKELQSVLDQPVDIFLATHHGSAEGSVQQLLDVTKPRWAVISAGPNQFHHPRPEALARLEQIGATIWCTDTNGSITARISAKGTLTWRTSLQHAPWWSGRDQQQNGTCVGR